MLNRSQLLFDNVVLMVSRKDIVQYWAWVTSPTEAEWASNLDWCMRAKRLVYRVGGGPHKFEKVWAPWQGAEEVYDREDV
ncbi:hypothetical protein NDU88_001844 [Pleurodeles waltl]|uniref:Uncharacterized protein n=1 Tax=Pleurodeles waltl TaxID=8319 RepID=A0AAV7WJJ6_PLEWA|nr:hypothetical protein NDU88_001844 [Pleurodeles waltl]